LDKRGEELFSRKRGQYFEIDAIIAIIILIAGLIYINQLKLDVTDITQHKEYADEVAGFLKNVKMGELSDEFLEVFSDYDEDLSIGEQIYSFHLESNDDAEDLAGRALDQFVSSTFSYGIWIIEGDTVTEIYNMDYADNLPNIAVSRILVTGSDFQRAVLEVRVGAE
jgi:hypothetical protein